MQRELLKKLLSLSIATFIAGCGSSSATNSTSTSTATVVSSLSKLPDLSSMLTGTASASISRSHSLTRALVSGTPTALQDISSSNADALFWNGMIAGINASPPTVDVSDPAVVNSFFQDASQCYMAQGVGYSMQNIESAGTSLCYMKRAPLAVPADAVTPTTAAAAIMSQDANTKLLKINATNMPGHDDSGGNSKTIFIKIFGSTSSQASAGFATDLWFCSGGSATEAENIRYNSDTHVMTDTSVNSNEGNIYTNIFSASLLAQSDGSFAFDPDQARSSEMFSSSPSWGDFKASIAVLGDQMTSKNSNRNTFDSRVSINKNYSWSQIGTSGRSVFFYQGGVVNTFDSDGSSNTFVTGTEWQSSYYVPVSSGTYYDTVSSIDLSTDSFYSSMTVDSTLTSSLSTYDCSSTPDIEINMDMSTDAMAPVIADCEQHWQNMDFCNSSDVQQAMAAMFTAQGPH